MARLRNRLPLANEWVELIGTVLVIAVVLTALIVVGRAIFGAPAGATDLDCRPTITGTYADYDGQAAVTLTVPDYCTTSQAVRLVVFSLPAGVTALTPESLDADQTPTVIVDATLEPGVPKLLDPGEPHGCGDLQIDVAPDNADWSALRVGVVAPHNLPGAYTASAEHADDQCVPCTFAVSAPDAPAASVSERHDDAPCGLQPAVGAPGEQTGPAPATPVLSAPTQNAASPPPPSVGDTASSEADTGDGTSPASPVSASAAPTLAAAPVLPVTGIDAWWLIELAILLLFCGALLLVVGPDIFRGKEKRS